MVRKVAIHHAVQFLHLAADGAQQIRRAGTGYAIAAVHHHLHAAGQLNVLDDEFAVGGQHISLLHRRGRPGRQVSNRARQQRLHALAQVLHRVAIQGLAVQHHLEAVVVLGVVAAGDLNTVRAQGVGCEVQLRRSALADVDHLHACR